jgi:hypothetical protein
MYILAEMLETEDEESKDCLYRAEEVQQGMSYRSTL